MKKQKLKSEVILLSIIIVIILISCISISISIKPKANPNTTQKKRPLYNRPMIAFSKIYEPGHLNNIQKICPKSGHQINLVIGITSEPKNFHKRLAIRQTWGSFALRKGFVVAFILGVTTNKTISKMVQAEEKKFADIILSKFLEGYGNLTLKTLSLFEWTRQNCPKAKFLLKTDDDMFVNIWEVFQHILHYNVKDRAIYGDVYEGFHPIHDPYKQSYIARELYNKSAYPNYTTGAAYLLPVWLIDELYKAALDGLYFRLEDVFFTGILASKLNIDRRHIARVTRRMDRFKIPLGVHLSKAIVRRQFKLWNQMEFINK